MTRFFSFFFFLLIKIPLNVNIILRFTLSRTASTPKVSLSCCKFRKFPDPYVSACVLWAYTALHIEGAKDAHKRMIFKSEKILLLPVHV